VRIRIKSRPSTRNKYVYVEGWRKHNSGKWKKSHLGFLGRADLITREQLNDLDKKYNMGLTASMLRRWGLPKKVIERFNPPAQVIPIESKPTPDKVEAEFTWSMRVFEKGIELAELRKQAEEDINKTLAWIQESRKKLQKSREEDIKKYGKNPNAWILHRGETPFLPLREQGGYPPYKS